MKHERVPTRSRLGDIFDRSFRALHGIPDATLGKATTIRTVTGITEQPQTFIVQTVRHRELGDSVFVEYIDADGSMRLVLPPAVIETIARQRDALTTKIRRRSAKAEAARRKAAGIKPGFLKLKAK